MKNKQTMEHKDDGETNNFWNTPEKSGKRVGEQEIRGRIDRSDHRSIGNA